MKNQLKEVLEMNRKNAGRLLLLLALLYPLTCIVTVKTNETAVVMHLGRIQRPYLQAGIHIVRPWPFSSVVKVDTRMVRTFMVTDFSPHRTPSGDSPGLPHLITADKNLVQMSMRIRYTVREPAEYLFGAADVEGCLRALARDILIEEVARREVERIITTGKLQLSARIEKRLQQEASALELGVSIRGVELEQVSPPLEVLPFFKKVVNAQVGARTRLHFASSEADRLLLSARSRADALLEQARADAHATLERAKGWCDTFEHFLARYREAPRATVMNLHRRMLERVLPSLQWIFITDGRRPPRRIRIVTGRPGGAPAPESDGMSRSDTYRQ